jgi:plasmid replication initiation protein
MGFCRNRINNQTSPAGLTCNVHLYMAWIRGFNVMNTQLTTAPNQEAQSNQYVVKSNRLIEASYRLTLREQQIILYAIMQARETQTGLTWQKPCEINVIEFAKAFQITHKDIYDEAKQAIKTLFDRSVTTYSEMNGHEVVTHTRWISQRVYSDKNGHLSLTFAPEVVQYITRLETEFTRYELTQIGQLTSVYAVRLYELLKQYQTAKKREITIEWLKTHLQIQNEYKEFHNFKSRVIDMSIKQINQHTDLSVKATMVKKGRKAHAFEFTIKAKPTQPAKPRQTAMRLKTPQIQPYPGESQYAYDLRKRNAGDTMQQKPQEPTIANTAKTDLGTQTPSVAEAALAELRKLAKI